MNIQGQTENAKENHCCIRKPCETTNSIERITAAAKRQTETRQTSNSTASSSMEKETKNSRNIDTPQTQQKARTEAIRRSQYTRRRSTITRPPEATKTYCIRNQSNRSNSIDGITARTAIQRGSATRQEIRHKDDTGQHTGADSDEHNTRGQQSTVRNPHRGQESASGEYAK